MLERANREFGQTVLMITHNPEAAVIADRILHMRDGEITGVESGSRTRARLEPVFSGKSLSFDRISASPIYSVLQQAGVAQW